MEKTARKTVGRPFTGADDPRNGHGKKGRSGRKSDAFLRQCIATIEDPEIWKHAAKKQPLGLLTLAASYIYGHPKQNIDVSGEVDVLVHEARRAFQSRMDRLAERLGAAAMPEWPE